MNKSKFPLLYQVNPRVWLTSLAAELGRPTSLDDIPDVDLDRIATQGFEWVYFFGVWQTGEAGKQVSRSNPEWLAEYRQVLPDLEERDICGSPFAITDYSAHQALGGDAALLRLRKRLNLRGLRLMLDFVPNHTAPDHPWVWVHPEYYILGTPANLEGEPQNYMLVDTTSGSKILARGRDPYFPGWLDTVQLNYANLELRRELLEILLKIAGVCDGLRCDMAMLVLPEIFEQTWGFTTEPFWPVVIPAVRQVYPEFVFMAEVYWDLEATLLEQGFDYAYDKRLYDQLKSGQVEQVLEHLQSVVRVQNRLARFLENHDEARAAAVFPPDIHKAAAMVTFFSPCLRFIHQGQLEGFQTKISVHLCRGPKETGEVEIAEFYRRFLECINRDVFRSGEWQFLEARPAWSGAESHAGFISYAWQGADGSLWLIVVNYSAQRGQCSLSLPFAELAVGQVRLEDKMNSLTYERDGNRLLAEGLYLDLPAWGYHLFEVRIPLPK